MKTCTKCGIEKELTEFHKDNRSTTGYMYICKQCRKEYVNNPQEFNKKHAKIIPEGKKWCSKCKEFKNYDEFYIDKSIGYSSYCKNCESLRHKKVTLRKIIYGKKQCPKCSYYKDYNEFYTNNKHKDKLCTYCKECDKKIKKSNKLTKIELITLVPGKRLCPNCNNYKYLHEFSKDKANKSGLQCHCKDCKNKERKNNRDAINKHIREYKINNKEKIKESNAKYHNEHREIVNVKSKLNRRKNAIYLNMYNKLTIEEEPRLAEDGVSLEVKCSNCKIYFIPTRKQVQTRVSSLNSILDGENRLYCSEECKKNCSIFRKNTNHYLVINDNKDLPYTQSELNIWAETVKANNESGLCEICGEPATDAHHELPKKTYPQYALDLSNGIAVCEECHKKLHTGACSTGRLANTPCKLK